LGHFGDGTSPALSWGMMLGGYEVCLLTSPVRDALPKLRQMVSPLYRLHHKTLDCVELHYSHDRDALLLRLCFSELHLGRDRQRELVLCLAERGFEVLESSEISEPERPRFERLLREQYQVRVQQYPSAESPSVVSKILDSLEAHFEPAVATVRPTNADAGSSKRAPSTRVAVPRVAVPHIAIPKAAPRMATVDALDHIIAEIPMFEVDVEGSRESIEIAANDDRAATEIDDEVVPLRMETFGPLDDMIAKLPREMAALPRAMAELPRAMAELPRAVAELPRAVAALPRAMAAPPRAQTQESLDQLLDKLWP